MTKRLTLDFIKKQFEERDYILLSKEYKNNRQKLEYMCPEGHRESIRWDNFQRDGRCPQCFPKNKRLTISFIKSETLRLSNNKYKCVSDEYKGWNEKLSFKCDRDHIYETCWYNFKDNCRCPICSKVKKYTTEEIRQEFAKEGYILLSEYIKAKDHLKVLCPEGHIWETATWDHFRKGVRCLYCGKHNPITIEYISDYVSEFGYECLSKEYEGPHKKLKLLCDKGHKVDMTWAHIQQGHRCRYCRDEYLSKLFRYNYTEEELKEMSNYRTKVNRCSEDSYKKYKHLINPDSLIRGRNKYHLDHIYSVIDGFNNDVSAEIISHPVNLRMMTEHDNIAKNGRSDMTLDKLYEVAK